MKQQFRVILFNKPFNVLCQFRTDGNNSCLSDFIKTPDFYCAGRLDKDSEGLLLLTNCGKLQHLISHPKHKLNKVYWVQVEGEPDQTELRTLAAGVILNDGPCLPCHVRRIAEPAVWPRHPPIRERKNKLTSWLEIELHEGRNRQVRRMTAAIGYPTLRLIRQRIGPFDLGELQPGESRERSLSLEQLPARWQRYLLQSAEQAQDSKRKAYPKSARNTRPALSKKSRGTQKKPAKHRKS